MFLLTIRKGERHINVVFVFLMTGRKKSTIRKGPIWIDSDGQIKHDIPIELQGLTLGEQLLIQKYSPYIPVVHIKHGTLGTHGHCISFPKDMSSLCTSLPRTDCSVIRFVRSYGNKVDGSDTKFKELLIRKKKVMGALFWLKKNNPLYRDDESVVIDINNLSWMGHENESEMENIININDDDDDKIKSNASCTVSTVQTSGSTNSYENLSHNENMECGGAVVHKSKLWHNTTDKLTVMELKKALHDRGVTIPSMDFPLIKQDPIDEYSGTSLFAGAFPWLFQVV